MTISKFTIASPQYLAVRFSGVNAVNDICEVANEASYIIHADRDKISIQISNLTIQKHEYLVRDPHGELSVMTMEEVGRKFDPVEPS